MSSGFPALVRKFLNLVRLLLGLAQCIVLSMMCVCNSLSLFLTDIGSAGQSNEGIYQWGCPSVCQWEKVDFEP